jgi:hypothetical protein
MQINESKIAFICFYLFFGIGTFQCVTADKNKKSFAAFASLEISSEGSLLFPMVWREVLLTVPPTGNLIADIVIFRNKLSRFLCTVNCLTLARSPPWAA